RQRPRRRAAAAVCAAGRAVPRAGRVDRPLPRSVGGAAGPAGRGAGASEGGQEGGSARRLARPQQGERDMSRRMITIERTFNAAIEDVWALWTTADGIESWWGPEGFR